MENDQDLAEPARPPSGDSPLLPARSDPTPSTADVWAGVEPEPEHLHHNLRTADGRGVIRLMPTTAARLMATAGWVGNSIAMVLLLRGLAPSFRDGDPNNFWVPLDEHAWFSAVGLVSAVVAYLGWFWWTLSATFNARRLVPMATSPWLPTMVYMGGPVIVLAGLDASEDWRFVLVATGCVWIAAGHFAVLFSLRNTAGRIGAARDDLLKLILFPLAGAAWRAAVEAILMVVDDEWKTPGLLFAFGGVGVLFVIGTAAATWHAATAFDQACRRLSKGTLGVELPSVDVITAALRRHALERR
ncbi:MAG: hypothetical protein AB7L17_07610 [Ilumatobacteraceae bacterium]